MFVGKGLFKGKNDILPCCHPWEKTVILENYATVESRAGDRPSVESQHPFRRQVKARQKAKEGTFAAAGRAEEADEIPGCSSEADIIQHVLAAVGK